MRKILVLLFLPLVLAACAAEPIWAPEAAVRASTYRHDGPTSLTLFTVVSNGSGEGAHSGLLINASQRVLFDPAGTWKNKSIPERNDVMFGMTDRVVGFYTDFHTRKTYHTIVQTLEVSPAVAERALQDVLNYGAVPKALCATSVSKVLTRLPGFQGFKGSIFPKKLMRNFAKIPGVKTQTLYDDDSDNNSDLLQRQNAVN